MSQPTPDSDAALALALLAVAPDLGGIQVCGLPGPGRDVLLARATELLARGDRSIRLPLGVGPERLLGGLDLAASLARPGPESNAVAGGPVLQSGLLSQAHASLLVVNMAERQPREVVSALLAALDTGQVRVERDGFGLSQAAEFVLLALDEALDDDDPMDLGLADRLAFRVYSDHFDALPPSPFSQDQMTAAKARLPALTPAAVSALDQAAISMGIVSLRRVGLAARVAAVLSALRDESSISGEALGDAARLVLVPYALMLPGAEDQPPESPDQPPPPEDDQETHEPESSRDPDNSEIPEDMLVAAAKAVLPAGVMANLAGGKGRRRGGAGGRSKVTKPATRGRPTGIRSGQIGRGARLNLLATLKAAAPWQRVRQASASGARPDRLAIRLDDFRVTRFQQKSQLTTLFVVDASGSSAIARLAEVKGAIELLLADCYVRRDQVALLAFRGNHPELLLPPTRSLARAKRALADLPGGGATPLAGALDAARELACGLARRHHQPVLVVLTDGRGNVSRDGTPGHPEATSQTLQAAADLALEGFNVLLVDIARRPRPRARELAEAMGARYLILPQMDAQHLSSAVQQVSGMAA